MSSAPSCRTNTSSSTCGRGTSRATPRPIPPRSSRSWAPRSSAPEAAGVTAIVECSTVGVGRRADIDRAVSVATGFPLVVPTGIYREPWVPDWAHEASEDALYEWMLGELSDEIAGTGVQAGWIKLSAGDDGLTASETKILRAAARAAKATGSVIGSHTIRGRVVRDQLDIIEAAGLTPDRFIWIHTQAEPSSSLHLEVARRGAWIEYDAIGSDDFDDAHFVALISDALAAGLGGRLLLSQDRGMYDPGPAGWRDAAALHVPDRSIPAATTQGRARRGRDRAIDRAQPVRRVRSITATAAGAGRAGRDAIQTPRPAPPSGSDRRRRPLGRAALTVRAQLRLGRRRRRLAQEQDEPGRHDAGRDADARTCSRWRSTAPRGWHRRWPARTDGPPRVPRPGSPPGSPRRGRRHRSASRAHPNPRARHRPRAGRRPTRAGAAARR